jgi:hypothetical protein
MSRNVNDTMDNIFDVLKKYVDEDDATRIVPTKRHIIADCDEEPVIDFVKSSKINITFYNQIKMISFDYKEQKYVLVQEIYESIIQKLGLDFEMELAILQGAGMIAISEECLIKAPKITSLDIINNCLGMIDEKDEQNISFKFSQIMDLFIPYCLVKVDEDRFQLQFEEDMHRLYGYMIMKNSFQFTPNTLHRLSSTLLLLSSRSIAASIINCLESRLIEYSFLQLYQCLEYLFVIDKSLRMSNIHDISIGTAIDIIASYNLKITEEESLYQVLKNNTSEGVIQTIYDLTNQSEDEKTDKFKIVASYIYRIRCNIAHLRYNQDKILCSIEWDKLIDAISEIIYSIYQKLDNDIISICSYNELWKMSEWKLTNK